MLSVALTVKFGVPTVDMLPIVLRIAVLLKVLFSLGTVFRIATNVGCELIILALGVKFKTKLVLVPPNKPLKFGWVAVKIPPFTLKFQPFDVPDAIVIPFGTAIDTVSCPVAAPVPIFETNTFIVEFCPTKRLFNG